MRIIGRPGKIASELSPGILQCCNLGPAHNHTPRMRELSVAEQRYQAAMAVIGDGWSVSQVGEKIGAKTTCAERLRACSAC
jgi:hypothetical protein